MACAEQGIDDVISALQSGFQFAFRLSLGDILPAHGQAVLFPAIQTDERSSLGKMICHYQAITPVIARSDQKQDFEAIHRMMRQEMGLENVCRALASILH